MSSTRYAPPGSDPDDSPERHLSDPTIAGINIGLNVIGRVAVTRSVPERRAMVWLHNYARMMQLTADALSGEMDLTRADIRSALNNPNYQHFGHFCKQVAILRADFEKRLPVLCQNRVSKAVRKSMLEGYEDKVFSMLIGPERIGKSEALLDNYLRHYMDRGIFLTCPESRDMRSFIISLAAPCGIAASRAKKNDCLRDQVVSIIATGVVEVIAIDEMQRIFPTNLVDAYPEKIEFVRTLWDSSEVNRRARRGRDGGGGVGVVGAVTPQFEDDLNTTLLVNKRWKPGQFEGRMRRTHTPDTLNEKEVADIARHHAPDFSPACISKLTAVTLASPGLLGFLCNVIGKTRFEARTENIPITPDLVSECARMMLKGTTTEKNAKAKAARNNITRLN